MATVTVYSTISSPDGYKTLLCGVQATSNYQSTGDPIRPGTEVNAVNAIVCMFPTAANGVIPEWSNSQNVMFYKLASNAVGAVNIPLVHVTAATNMVNYTFPTIIVGRTT